MGGVGEPGLKGDKVIGTLPYCPWVIRAPFPRDPPTAWQLCLPLYLLSSVLCTFHSGFFWLLGVWGPRGQLWRPDG